jgi:NAD-dependent aldehyde dehydrogenases
MVNALKFYIDGAWVEPSTHARRAVVDPCTEQPIAEVAMGTPVDADRAVAAANVRSRRSRRPRPPSVSR